MWKANTVLSVQRGIIGARQRTGEDGQRQIPADPERASNGQYQELPSTRQDLAGLSRTDIRDGAEGRKIT